MLKNTYKVVVIAILFSTIFTAKSEEHQVNLGAQYADQVWFHLDNGVVQSDPKNNWDLAFLIPRNASVLINSMNQIKLWHVPFENQPGWGNALDTTGMATDWEELYNSLEMWDKGAFSLGKDGTEPANDFGWGEYNFFVHKVIGSELFVIKLGSGEYKQIMLDTLTGTEFTFSYSNLDGSESITEKIQKKDEVAINKNFMYYKFDGREVIDRDPNKQDWHLVFGQYMGFASMGGPPIPYPLVGVKSNIGVKVAKLTGVEDKVTVKNPEFDTEVYTENITTIGADWKSFNNTTFQWSIPEDWVYFLTTADEETENPVFYRLFFTDFGGSSTGLITFQLEEVVPASVEDDHKKYANFAVYPNVVESGAQLNVAINSFESFANAKLEIIDMTGRTLLTNELNPGSGFVNLPISTANFNTGVYFINLNANGVLSTQKFIVK